MVPRFGLAASNNLRAAIVALHREGLSQRVLDRFTDAVLDSNLASEASGAVLESTRPSDADREWAQSIMSWLRTEAMVEEVMFPPGRVLWGPPGLSEEVEVMGRSGMHRLQRLVLCPDATSFGEMQL